MRGFLESSSTRRSSRPCRRCRAPSSTTTTQLIERRFSNPKIGDTIRRLCLDGSNRQPKFIIPTIADRLSRQAGRRPGAGFALWCRYCFGTTDTGAVIEPNDPSWDRLRRGQGAKDDPAAWLAMGDIYGEVGRRAGLRRCLRPGCEALWEDGTARDAAGATSGHALSGERAPRPDLVIFDCDGVLVDSEPIVDRALLLVR